jgi:single-strand DNA-binding protein
MSGFNKVILLGNLTRDPELRYLPSQTAVADFGLATNRRYRTKEGEDREETVFVELTAFGKQAETLHQFCRKGRQLMVEGRLKYDQWEDKDTKAKRSRLSVIVENFQFVGSRDQTDNDDTAGPTKGQEEMWKDQRQDAAKRENPKSEPRRPAKAGAAARYKDADIPF